MVESAWVLHEIAKLNQAGLYLARMTISDVMLSQLR